MSKATLFGNRLKHAFFTITQLRKHLIANCEPYDIQVKFQLQDGLGRDIYYKLGVYSEDYITQYLLANLAIGDNDLILDIGANIGWYSLVLSSRAHPTILAFEPDKNNFSLLTQNIEMNKRLTVKAYNKAVSDKNGELTLHLYKGYNTGRHSFIKQKNSIGTAKVPIVILDDFLEKEGHGEGPIKLLKIDIEGYELTALHKATKTLARTQYLLTEFSPEMMVSVNQDPMEYIRLLEGAGFALRVIDETGLHQPDFEKIMGGLQQVNLLGTKP